MLLFVVVLALLTGAFAVLFCFLPVRMGSLVALLGLVGIGYLWSLPRYYLLDMSEGLAHGPTTVVINEAATGRNWSMHSPVSFGDIRDIGKFSAGLVTFCLLAGGLLGYKYKQERAWRKG